MYTGRSKPMVKLRLNIEPASAAGCEQRGTLVIQVGVFCVNRCILVVSLQLWGLPGLLAASVAAFCSFRVSFCCLTGYICVLPWHEACLRSYMSAQAT